MTVSWHVVEKLLIISRTSKVTLIVIGWKKKYIHLLYGGLRVSTIMEFFGGWTNPINLYTTKLCFNLKVDNLKVKNGFVSFILYIYFSIHRFALSSQLRVTVWSLCTKSVSYIKYPKACQKGEWMRVSADIECLN